MDVESHNSPGQTSTEQNSSNVTSLPGPIDLRIVEYVTDFDRHLQCPICRCPFIDPVRLSCDHTYCRLCYKRALQNQSTDTKTCPTCRQRIRDDNVPVPRFVVHMIEDLPVKCINSTTGCEAKLTRGELQNHITYYCSFSMVPCPDVACSQQVARHVKVERCMHERLACRSCRTEMMEFELSEHLSSRCTSTLTTCRACESSMPVSELEEHHSKICPEATIPCPGTAIGCTFETKRRSLRYHTEKCPMASMAPHIKTMTKRADDQAAMLRALQTKNDLLESSFAAMQTLLADHSSMHDPLAMLSTDSSYKNSRAHHEEDSQSPMFDSAAHHMLSLHEQLREELDRVSAAISEVDGRASMTIINETLRIREEMTHQNGVISSIRAQLQWLMSARLQAVSRGPTGSSSMSSMGMQASSSSYPDGQPIRRLSDTSRQETKL